MEYKQIVSLKYTEPTLNFVYIVFTDGSIGQSSLTDGVRRQYTDDVENFISLGGVILPQYTLEELALIDKEKEDALKQEELNKLIVTVSTGKRFYADPSSRADLADAISILMENGLVDYNWKTVDGIVLVTLEELKEARTLGLQAKGTSVGIA